MATATTKKAARPVHEIRLGKVKAAVWRNETQNGARHNVTLSRLYKDGDVWKDSQSFGRDDLLVAALVLQKAFEWCMEQNGS